VKISLSFQGNIAKRRGAFEKSDKFGAFEKSDKSFSDDCLVGK